MCESNFICISVFILVYICTHAVFIAPATDESEEFLNMSAPSPIGGGCLWQLNQETGGLHVGVKCTNKAVTIWRETST